MPNLQTNWADQLTMLSGRRDSWRKTKSPCWMAAGPRPLWLCCAYGLGCGRYSARECTDTRRVAKTAMVGKAVDGWVDLKFKTVDQLFSFYLLISCINKTRRFLLQMVPSRSFGSINVPGSLGVLELVSLGISAFPTIHHCLGMLPLRKLIIASEEGALVVASAGGTKQEIWGKMWGWERSPTSKQWPSLELNARMPCADRLVKDVRCSHGWLQDSGMLGQGQPPDPRFLCPLSW